MKIFCPIFSHITCGGILVNFSLKKCYFNSLMFTDIPLWIALLITHYTISVWLMSGLSLAGCNTVIFFSFQICYCAWSNFATAWSSERKGVHPFKLYNTRSIQKINISKMTISVLALGYFNFQQFNPYRTHTLRWFFNNSGCYRTTSPYNNSSIFTLSFKNCIYTVYLCLLPLLLIVVIVEVIYDLKHLNATNILKKN